MGSSFFTGQWMVWNTNLFILIFFSPFIADFFHLWFCYFSLILSFYFSRIFADYYLYFFLNAKILSLLYLFKVAKKANKFTPKRMCIFLFFRVSCGLFSFLFLADFRGLLAQIFADCFLFCFSRIYADCLRRFSKMFLKINRMWVWMMDDG